MARKKRKTIFIVILLTAIVMGALVFLHPDDQPLVGHIHMTYGGGFRDAMTDFVREAFDVPVSFLTTSSGDLRDYLTLALERGSSDRGLIFSYNHRQIHSQLEAARPFIAEFPRRYYVREEFAELVDPGGELHLVWVDAYVIIYNPDMISFEKVPSTLKELAKGDQAIGVPTTGCLGSWGTMAFYHHLGEENFRELMTNAEVTGSLGEVTRAVKDGTVALGISSLLDVRVRDGQVGVLWPEDGAIAKPALMVITDEHTDYHLRMADIIMSQEAAELFATEFNMASARVGGPVPTIVEENDFNFIFIPTQAIICEATGEKVDQIIGN